MVNSPVVVVSLCLYFTQKISIPAHFQSNEFKQALMEKGKEDANDT